MKKDVFEVLTKSEITNYLQCKDFDSNCFAANSDFEIKNYGESVYYVNSKWKQKQDKANDTRPIIERIKTFEDVCKELDINVEEWYKSHNFLEKNVLAYAKLCLICKVLNEKRTLQFKKDERVYVPWITKNYSINGDCIGFIFNNRPIISENTIIDYNISLFTKELAIYCGKQFFNIWIDLIDLNK